MPFEPSKNQGKNSVFRFSGFRFLAHFSLFLFLVLFAAKKISSKFFQVFRGGQKTGENKGFFCLSRGSLFWRWCFSVWCPHARVSLHVPSSLHMCHLSLMSYFILLFSFCFPLCFFCCLTFMTSVVLYQWPKTWTNHWKPQCLKFLFLMFCFGACALTLSPGPHNNRNPKPSTPENRICLLHNALNPVLKCLFLQCFSNINQMCPQIGP